MRLKCCVGGCDATSDTHRLFTFPKNDGLRNLWMSFVVPTNPLLIGLAKEQLLRKRVCEKHFDKYQFDREAKRLRYSYPCLFTDVEIAHGEPRPPAGAVEDVLSEHNYYKEQDNEEENVTEAMLVIGRAGENFHEHRYCSSSQADMSITEAKDVCSEEHLTSVPPSEVPATMKHTDVALEKPECSNKSCEKATSSQPRETNSKRQIVVEATIHNKTLKPKRQDSFLKTLGAKRRKFVKQVTNIATSSLGHTALQRLRQAAAYGSNEQLFTNFKYLNKQAQTFLIMQLKLCRKNKMARRFTMEEKLMALVMMKQSPKAYKLLEAMFALPNTRTLHRLAENVSMEPGVNPQIFKYIANTTKNWETKQKLCNIVFDEIALTPYLTFNEKIDQIIGFVDVAGERKMRYSDHALVFMIRGVCSSWRQSIAYYFCEGTVSAAALQNILTQIVSEVAQIGLTPLGLVCDQGSTFRTAMKKFREDTQRRRNKDILDKSQWKDDGTINIAGHDLNIFFDPPHLLKSIRNNFLNKDINWEGKVATWKDIQMIYDLDLKMGHTRALPKLTAHHVDPDKVKKMKVSVAAQVFSARTATMLRFAKMSAINFGNAGPENTATGSMEDTAAVLEFFDTLFDSVNGCPGGAAKGKLRKAVKVNSGHHSFWTHALLKLKKMTFVDKSSKTAIRAGKPRIVRVPCLDGWLTTIESFVRISKILFNEYGVEYYYPRFINQDPLENFFGRIRALNYRNVKPNANTFMYAFKSLALTNLLTPHSKFANCEVDSGENLLDMNYLFLKDDNDKENDPPIITSLPSTSQAPSTLTLSNSASFTKNEAVLERVRVQVSAYTAGYISRKMSRLVNCQSCLETFTSSSAGENVHAYIKSREYKTLKNNKLSYPSAKFLILYREASSLIHGYLNLNCHQQKITLKLRAELIKYLKFSWLGCKDEHNKVLVTSFLKFVIKLQCHNWCKIINKILQGSIEEKHVSKMENMQKLAFIKYKSYKLRQKAINK